MPVSVPRRLQIHILVLINACSGNQIVQGTIIAAKNHHDDTDNESYAKGRYINGKADITQNHCYDAYSLAGQSLYSDAKQSLTNSIAIPYNRHNNKINDSHYIRI